MKMGTQEGRKEERKGRKTKNTQQSRKGTQREADKGVFFLSL